MDRPRPARREDVQRVGVIQVLNADVADRQYDRGSQTITVPGIATLIEKQLAELDGKARTGITVIAYPQINSLLIRGSEQQLRLIRARVAQLDVPQFAQGQGASTPLSADQYERVRRAFARVGEQ
nr:MULTISPECIES: secretin N-terminal domain-containing protein [unclassified Pseudomonas]